MVFGNLDPHLSIVISPQSENRSYDEHPYCLSHIRRPECSCACMVLVGPQKIDFSLICTEIFSQQFSWSVHLSSPINAQCEPLNHL